MEKAHTEHRGAPSPGRLPSARPSKTADFIWSVADLLRGDYKRSEYGNVVLPLTVLRRLDGILAPTRTEVLERYATLPKRFDAILNRISGMQFNNVSEIDLRKVLDDSPIRRMERKAKPRKSRVYARCWV